MAKRGKKQCAKLRRRIADWEAMKAGNTLHGGRVKVVGGDTFRKPGSQRK